MNDSIAGHNISSHNIRSTSIEIDLNATFGSFDEIDRLTTNGLNGTSSGSSSNFSSDNMSQDNGLLLFIGQRSQDFRINFGESFIGRSENSQSFSTLQSFNQTQV